VTRSCSGCVPLVPPPQPQPQPGAALPFEDSAVKQIPR
jgi:hypothetical protein